MKKNIILTIVSFIIFYLFLHSSVMAISYNDLADPSQHLFCIEHGGPLDNGYNIKIGDQMGFGWGSEEHTVTIRKYYEQAFEDISADAFWKSLGTDIKSNKYKRVGGTIHRKPELHTKNHKIKYRKREIVKVGDILAKGHHSYNYRILDTIYINTWPTNNDVEAINNADLAYSSRYNQTKKNDWCARMAYIIGKGGGSYNSSNSGRKYGKYSDTQMAIYSSFTSFLKSPTAWDGSVWHDDSAYGNNMRVLNDEADNYIRELNERKNLGVGMKDQNTSNKTVSFQNYNNRIYYQIGPFNYSYKGTINSVELYTGSSKRSNLLFKTDNVIAGKDNIKNGKNFYILYPADQVIDSNIKVKINYNDTFTVYYATIQILESQSTTFSTWFDHKEYKYTRNHTQDLIRATGGGKNVTKNENIEFNYNNSLGSVTVKKVDNKTGQILTGATVKFKLKNRDTGLWVTKSNGKGDGQTAYSSSNATIFQTSGGQCVISNLVKGNYEIYEISINDQDFKTPNANVAANLRTGASSGTTINFANVNGNNTTYLINNKKVGNLWILKVDKNNTAKGLNGISFKLVYKYYGVEYLVKQESNGTISYQRRDTAKSIKDDGGTIFKTGNYGNPPDVKNYAIKDGWLIGANGKPYIEGLDIGTYYAYEISKENNSEYQDPDPNSPVKIESSNNIELKVISGNTNKYRVYNKKYTGRLKVYKKDVHKNIPIANMKFKLHYMTESKVLNIFDENANKYVPKEFQKWVKQDGNGNISYVNSENEATVFTTDSNGILRGINKADTIGDLDIGEYQAVELKDGTLNYKLTSNMTIKKADKDKNGNENSRTVNNFADIIITRDQTKEFNTYNINNPSIVPVSGKVWTPSKTGKDEKPINSEDKEQTRYNENSILLKNVKVDIYAIGKLQVITTTATYEVDPITGTIYKLVNGNRGSTISDFSHIEGELIRTKMVACNEIKLNQEEIRTDDSGKYKFNLMGIYYKDVQLPYYRVRFTYDGMDFQGCVPNIEKRDENTSKATEDAQKRRQLNLKYQTVTGNRDRNKTKGDVYNSQEVKAERSKQLNYEIKDGIATSTNKSAGYSAEKNKVITVNELLPGNENWKNGENGITATFDFNSITSASGSYGYLNDSQTEVIGINMALLRRESPDLAVTNKIQNVVTTVNGYNNLYTTVLTGKNTNKDVNIGVTYVKNDGELSKFTVYPSDVQTCSTNVDNKNKLRVYITYKVTITNQTTTVYSKAKELAVYYDKNYELKYIGESLEDLYGGYYAIDNENIKSNTTKYNSRTSNEAYTNTYVELNDVLAPGESKDLYMTYKVSDNEVAKMADTNVKYVPKLQNVIEITAYSSYYDKEGKNPYAGIDEDSAPDDVDLTVKTKAEAKDEDDTGRANEFTISQKDENDKERKLTGTVFLDSTSGELKSGEERLGDSVYSDNEKVIGNVTVKLEYIESNTGKNIVENPNEKYKTVNFDNIGTKETNTDANGTYSISGFVPGNYKIKYTYNNNSYYKDGGKTININAVDYKSTIVKDEANKTKMKTAFKSEETNKDWYKLDNPQKAEEVNKVFTRYNEAVDDWQTRQNIDSNYKNMSMNNTGIENKTLYKQSKKEDAENPSIIASTPTLGISVELNVLTNDNKYEPINYQLNNMDFGIVERARQSLKFEKKIKSAKVKLSTGQVIADVQLGEDGKYKVQGAKYLKPDKDSNGKVSIELDSELIHGSTLEAIYTMAITNISEIDYYTKEYYAYGDEGKDSIVKLTPKEILDYVDNGLIYVNSNDNNWELLNSDAIKNNYTEKINDSEIYSGLKKTQINTILKYTLNNILEPGETCKTPELKLEKLLSNTEDEDMLFGNKVELITAQKTGGRRIIEQLGTYSIKGDSGIGTLSQDVVITPPTGMTENINKVIYITITLGVLVIIAGGIVLVKKQNEQI